MALYIYSMYRFMQFYTKTYGEDDEAAEEGSYGSGLGSISSRSGSSATWIEDSKLNSFCTFVLFSNKLFLKTKKAVCVKRKRVKIMINAWWLSGNKWVSLSQMTAQSLSSFSAFSKFFLTFQTDSSSFTKYVHLCYCCCCCWKRLERRSIINYVNCRQENWTKRRRKVRKWF